MGTCFFWFRRRSGKSGRRSGGSYGRCRSGARRSRTAAAAATVPEHVHGGQAAPAADAEAANAPAATAAAAAAAAAATATAAGAHRGRGRTAGGARRFRGHARQSESKFQPSRCVPGTRLRALIIRSSARTLKWIDCSSWIAKK